MRAFAPILLTGVASALILKILMALLLPLAGAMLGFLGTVFKVGLIVLVVMFVIRMFRRRKEQTN